VEGYIANPVAFNKWEIQLKSKSKTQKNFAVHHQQNKIATKFGVRHQFCHGNILKMLISLIKNLHAA